MPTYRVEVTVEYREHYIVEADDEEQAEAMALSGSVRPVVSEAVPASEEVQEIEEID